MLKKTLKMQLALIFGSLVATPYAFSGVTNVDMCSGWDNDGFYTLWCQDQAACGRVRATWGDREILFNALVQGGARYRYDDKRVLCVLGEKGKTMAAGFTDNEKAVMALNCKNKGNLSKTSSPDDIATAFIQSYGLTNQ